VLQLTERHFSQTHTRPLFVPSRKYLAQAGLTELEGNIPEVLRAFGKGAASSHAAVAQLAVAITDHNGVIASHADALVQQSEEIGTLSYFMLGVPVLAPVLAALQEKHADLQEKNAVMTRAIHELQVGLTNTQHQQSLLLAARPEREQAVPVQGEDEDMEILEEQLHAEQEQYDKPDCTMPPGCTLVWVQLPNSDRHQWCVHTGTKAVPYMLWLTGEVLDHPGGPVAQAIRPQVRMPAPAHFSGEGADCDPEMALMAMENYLSSSGLPTTEWGRQVLSFLRGAAYRAYSSIALPLHASGRSPTWAQVRELVLSFKRRDAPTLARAKLASIRQVGTVVEFNNSFRLLLTQVGADPPAPTDQLGYYLKGLALPSPLSPWGAQWASLEDAMSFHAAKELAELRVTPHSTQRHRFPPIRAALKPTYTARLKTAQGTKRLAPFGERSVGGRGGRGGDQSGGRGRGRGDASGRGRGEGSGGGRGEGSGGGRGEGSGSGGRGYGGGYGGGGRNGGRGPGPSNLFGNNYAELMAGGSSDCPKHGSNHVKSDCRDFRAALAAFINGPAAP
jgi:hypothetical protein